jgi:hypothetical protein
MKYTELLSKRASLMVTAIGGSSNMAREKVS